MMSDPSNYHKEYSPCGSYPLFQFERSDVVSVLKNSIEYSFVFNKCLQGDHKPGQHGKPRKLREFEKLSKSQGKLREI